jgi:hypothetical protein
MLVTADWHLTDQLENEYRWQVFNELHRILTANPQPLYILGDLGDRKDRHPAGLVNRLVDELQQLQVCVGNHGITILMGNHDQPLNGQPFWNFLSELEGWVYFYDKPIIENGLALLPYSHDPATDWAELPLRTARCIFMHQTITGAAVNGITLNNPKMPELPTHCPIYSGDIHVPQRIGDNFHYVGAPHPVKFGDDYPCRILELDADYRIHCEHILTPPRKLVAEVRSIDELRALTVTAADQVRVRFHFPAAQAEQWPIEEMQIAQWAQACGVKLASVEAVLSMGQPTRGGGAALDEFSDPVEVLKAYAESEGIEEDLLDAGLALLQTSKE